MLEAIYESMGWEGINLVRQRFRQATMDGIGEQGELRGKVLTIEGFLGQNVPWSTIEAATGIDEPTFRRLKHQPDAAEDRIDHPN